MPYHVQTQLSHSLIFQGNPTDVAVVNKDFAHANMTKETQKQKQNKTKNKGRLTDVLQEKARPWSDPAVEYLLESTKDWSDKRQQQGIRRGGEKREKSWY